MTCLNDLVDGDDRPPIDAADAAEVFLFRDFGDEVTLGRAIYICHHIIVYHAPFIIYLIVAFEWGQISYF